MDGVNLQSLVKLISQSSGYISVNQSTEELKTEGSTFLGKIVIWVRFKFNRNYKEATQTAKSKIKDLLLADQIYGKNFQKRINELDPQGSIFYKDKPLSARKVYRFISEVQQDVGERINRAQDWVGWYSAKAGTIASQESFDGRTKAMLAEKIKNERSLTAEDVDLKGLSDEVNQAAVHDGRAMVAIRSEMDADEHVDKTLSEVLDRRIVASRLKLQDELNKQLAVSGLADEAKQSIATEIADTTIATMDELKTRVNKEVLKQIGDEFDGLLQQVKSTHGFNEQLMQWPKVKEQLHATLAQRNQDEMLSVAQAHKQATQLLNQWILSKQETIAALQSSQFAGMPNLLKKLVLQDPHIGKTQIESIQRDVEQTLGEIYDKDAATYEALGMDKGKFLSKLHQFNRQDLLFSKLGDLFKQLPKPPLFDDTNWQVADIRPVVQGCVGDPISPMVESYKKILALKGNVPDRICKILIEQVSKGTIWNPEFVSVANGLHIATLTENNYRGFYSLLQTPQVAQKRIGSKADLTHFTLDDLLKAMLDNKNSRNADKRRQAIDAVISPNSRDELIDELGRQMEMVKSRVMSAADAEALFQRGTLKFLQRQKISFEDRKATAEPEIKDPSNVQMSTPL